MDNNHSQIYHYTKLNDNCWLHSQAYHVHKENRKRYKGRERRCINPNGCYQYCSMKMVDPPQIKEESLCYFNIQSHCTSPSQTGLPTGFYLSSQINIDDLVKNITEYCLCSSKHKTLDMFYPLSCVCYRQNWTYCSINSPTHNDECNFMRKECGHRNSPPQRNRIYVRCKIRHNSSIIREDTFFNETVPSLSLPTIVYNASDEHNLFTVASEQIRSEDNTEYTVYPTMFPYNMNQPIICNEMTSYCSKFMLNIFHLVLFVLIAVMIYLEYMRRVPSKSLRNRDNG